MRFLPQMALRCQPTLGAARERERREAVVLHELLGDRHVARHDLHGVVGRARAADDFAPARSDVSGVCGGGLSTTEQPHASAGASLCATRLSGKLNGAMASTGPAGTRTHVPE